MRGEELLSRSDLLVQRLREQPNRLDCYKIDDVDLSLDSRVGHQQGIHHPDDGPGRIDEVLDPVDESVCPSHLIECLLWHRRKNGVESLEDELTQLSLIRRGEIDG